MYFCTYLCNSCCQSGIILASLLVTHVYNIYRSLINKLIVDTNTDTSNCIYTNQSNIAEGSTQYNEQV